MVCPHEDSYTSRYLLGPFPTTVSRLSCPE